MLTIRYFIICLLLTPSILEGLNVFKQSECGHSKSCLRWSSCDFPNCDYAFSWKKVDFNKTLYLQVELVGKLVNIENGYLALGFSSDTKMNDNGVVSCHMEEGNISISAGYNLKHKNYLLMDKEIDENYLVTSQTPFYGYIYDPTTNILRCRFLRAIKPILLVDNLKDLSNGQKYYLLSAKGSFRNGKLGYHSTVKLASQSSYDMESSDYVDNIITNNYLLIKIHSCLMIFGWIFCATNGIIIANFYKSNWSRKLWFGEKIWFQIHRSVQILCVVCVSSSFIIIFIHVNGYSTLGTLPNSAHPVMGIVATSLMLINPIMALFRCHPNNSSRWIFNRIHFLVGITGYVLAICTIIIGIQMPPSGSNLSNINYPWILVVIYLAFIIILFIYGQIKNHIRENTTVENTRIIHNNTIQEVITNINGKDIPAKYDVIILSIILSFGFGITFIVIILVN